MEKSERSWGGRKEEEEEEEEEGKFEGKEKRGVVLVPGFHFLFFYLLEIYQCV